LVLLVYFVGSAMADEIDVLIKQLAKGKESQRLAAARALGERKDPRGVAPLVSALKEDSNWGVRIAAEEALVKIGAPSAGPLVQILKDDKDSFVRRRAARALKELSDTCDPRALKNAAQQDIDRCVRRFVARALAAIKDPVVTEFLDDAMKKKNLEIISAAYAYYIRKGEPGSEEVLIEALHEGSYDKKLVFDFAYCGNEKLKQAADEIARKRGYGAPPESARLRWGTN